MVIPSGGQIVVDQLAGEGVRHLFMVPGESFLGVLDALHGDHRVLPITTRHESGAAMMAAATGRLTGRPGVAIVTRGPGAANALAGVYAAAQDQAPMVLLVGLPARAKRGLPAFQHIDLARVFGSLAKSVAIAETPAALAQRLAFALRSAVSGRPGPVVLGLPEDVLTQTARVPETKTGELPAEEPEHGDLASLNQLLAHADRPLVIAGGALWSKEAASALAQFAERYDLPVACAFRRQDRMDNSHRCYVGHLGFAPHAALARAVHDADVLIVLGSCLDEVTSGGFSLIKAAPEQKLVLIAPDADHTGASFVPDLAIAACAMRTAGALAQLATPGNRPPWPRWRRDLRAAYEMSLSSDAAENGEGVRLADIITHLSVTLPQDAILCSGAGNYAAVLHRYFVHRSYPGQLAPISGSMGYGLPAAIAAKLALPGCPVVALAGDGCFEMTGQELQTAVQLELPITLIVVNNGVMGTVRNAQLQGSTPRVIATSLVNPDFAGLARARGAIGVTVRSGHEFPAALQLALKASSPALVEVVTAP